ncbi:MAG: hypothetical protein LM573_04640 [Thermofilum sp.]|nr:hypothetical protein [Thermofilum sp.]
MLSVVPMCVAEELGLPVIGKMLFFDRGGSAERAQLLASSDVEVVLIGETALEILVLKVDPVREACRRKGILAQGLDSWGPAIVIVGLLVPV